MHPSLSDTFIKSKDVDDISHFKCQCSIIDRNTPRLEFLPGRHFKDLEKPGRDPRDEMPKPFFKSDVLSWKICGKA
jgi:hypothetical protein